MIAFVSTLPASMRVRPDRFLTSVFISSRLSETSMS